MSLRTERDYEDPSVTQIAVFLQNRVGQLREVLRCLDAASISVHALSVTDSADFAVVRLIVDLPAAALAALEREAFAVTESTVLAAEIPEGRAGLLGLTRALIQGEVNIHYLYPMLTLPNGKSVVVVHVDAVPTAIEVLRRSGCRLVDEQDLAPRE